MSLFINADDFGLSDGANRRILDAFDQGALHGASLLPNGLAFDSAVREYRKRPHLVLSVHVNLVEGRPISDPKLVPLLVDKRGLLNASFVKLWLRHLLSGPAARRELIEQVRREVTAQISKVKSVLNVQAELRVDSHMHLHMIPFVFQIVAGLAHTLGIKYIRLPREKFFFYSAHQGFLKAYFGANLVKHFLLNWLSGKGQSICRSRGIKSCDHFVGVLFTGSMTLGVAETALRSLPSDETVEILFHPGRPDDSERSLWNGRPDLTDYYYDEWREKELNTLLSPNFKKLLSSVENHEDISSSG